MQGRVKKMEFNLREQALQKTMIAAHRGISGGNIPCNTLDAFDAALYQGADMIELDVAASKDGQLFVFHPGMEPAHLGSARLIRDMTAQEVGELGFLNQDNVPSGHKINTLDQALEHLKGRCYINIDKFWENVEPITRAVRRHGMTGQILVKTAPNEAIFDQMERLAPELNYMLVIKERDGYSMRLRDRPLNYVGAEVLFEREDAPVASEAYIEEMHQNGLLVWANAIVYDRRAVLAAGHNDDISAIGRADEGWGWLLDKGFDIIQTDWPLALRLYMQGRRK